MGVKKRAITLRRCMFPPTGRRVGENVVLKFIDTASKLGHGRFQTAEEKLKFFGLTKKAEEAPKKPVEEKKPAVEAPKPTEVPK